MVGFDKEVSLYKVETSGCGVYYVVASSFDKAAESVKNALDAAEYGYSASREINSVEFIAKQEFMSGGERYLSGDKCNFIIAEE